nr:MAG TPA: hypothetical protein [Caudoviricetes sp.]
MIQRGYAPPNAAAGSGAGHKPWQMQSGRGGRYDCK